MARPDHSEQHTKIYQIWSDEAARPVGLTAGLTAGLLIAVGGRVLVAGGHRDGRRERPFRRLVSSSAVSSLLGCHEAANEWRK